jgi:hypothetical protein
MAFTESVIDRTKRIEKQLKDLGAEGVGLHDLASSVSSLLDDQLRFRLRYIITVRNKVVHEHDYVFDDDETEFIAKCDEVLQKLSALRPAQQPRAEIPAARPIAWPPQPGPSAAIRRRRRYPRLSVRQALRVLIVLFLVASIALAFMHRGRIEKTAAGAWQKAVAFYNNLTKAKPEQNKPRQTTARYSTVAEAQKAAMKKYPALGVAGSDFNKRFLALHNKYRKERPELFRDSNWPVTIADEVSAASK